MTTNAPRIACAAASFAAAVLLVTGCSTGSSAGDDSKAASSSPSDGVSSPSTDERTDAVGDVKITKSGVEDHEVWGPSSYVVHYTITNHGNQAADYFAQLAFLDKDGDTLGTTGVDANDLGPGKHKTADTAPVDAEIQNGKVSDIKSVKVSQVDRT